MRAHMVFYRHQKMCSIEVWARYSQQESSAQQGTGRRHTASSLCHMRQTRTDCLNKLTSSKPLFVSFAMATLLYNKLRPLKRPLMSITPHNMRALGRRDSTCGGLCSQWFSLFFWIRGVPPLAGSSKVGFVSLELIHLMEVRRDQSVFNL